MAIEVRLPQLGETMEEGTIVSYMVRVGDKVKKGDCIFEVETDKTAIEVESPADGFVRYILAKLGQTLPVGQTVMILAEQDEDVPQSFVDSLRPRVPAAAVETEAGPAPDEIETIEPAGPAAPVQQIELGSTIPLSRRQKIIAERMLRSKREIPCFYLMVKADVTELVEFRHRLNSTSDVKISYNDFVMRALAVGMGKFPIMTGHLAGDAIRLAESINIGLAVSGPSGLVVPVVKDVNKKDIAAIARDSSALIEKADNNRLLLTDLEGACITVSNLGAFGVDSFIPIVVPGQCSILGIGRITDACVPADDDNITVHKLMAMALSVDHRVTNGAYAGQFLDFVRKLLEAPSNLTK